MKKVKKEIVSSPEKSPEEDNENISWSHHLSESADVDKIKVKKEILSGHRNKRNGGEGDRDGESCFMRMDFHLAKQLLKDNKNAGLKLVKDKRHITIGWHQSGRVEEAVEKIFDASLSQFRRQLKGVPLAVGRIKVPKYSNVIGSQSCMHMDVIVDTIVFRPKPGRVYKCVVTSVDNEYLTAKIFGAISFLVSLKSVRIKPNIGDEVKIKFSELSFRGNICQMKGVLCSED